MIDKNKNNKALQAIQDLIIEARSKAYQNIESKDLGDFLDGLEYLPALVIEDGDNTELFENYLEELCKRNDCINVLNRYKTR